MQVRTFDSFHPEHTALYQQMADVTKATESIYPGAEKWFKEKFLDGLKRQERMYVVALNDDQTLAGFALLKNTEEEKKICTLFVASQFRRRGVGRQLIQQSITALGTVPLITVSQQTLSQFSGLLKRCGFHLSAQKKGVYNPKDTEYYFNDKKADAIKDELIPVLIQRMKQLKQK